MNRFFLALILLLTFALDATAQGFLCTPKTTFTPTAKGSTVASVTTDAGKADAFWCQDPVSKRWVPQYFIVLNKYANMTAPMDVVRRIIAAPDITTALNAELKAASIAPAVGSKDEYDYKTLRYKVCQLVWQPPYTTIDSVTSLVLSNDPLKCDAVPLPPQDQYATPASGTSLTIYKISAKNTLSSIVSGKLAPAASACDCTVTKIANGSSTYCPLKGGIATEVTLCRKTTP